MDTFTHMTHFNYLHFAMKLVDSSVYWYCKNVNSLKTNAFCLLGLSCKLLLFHEPYRSIDWVEQVPLYSMKTNGLLILTRQKLRNKQGDSQLGAISALVKLANLHCVVTFKFISTSFYPWISSLNDHEVCLPKTYVEL